MLGFESTTQAAIFCNHYGFIVENGDVLLDRTSFVEPETAPEPQRSITLVESKCDWSIGEVSMWMLSLAISHMSIEQLGI